MLAIGRSFTHSSLLRKLGLRFPSLAGQIRPGPAPRGRISGPCPPNNCLCSPNENCAPSSEDCAPKKLTGSVLLECKSRPETPNTLIIALEFVSKNCFFFSFCGLTAEFMKLRVYYGTKTFFFLVFTSEFVEICTNLGMKTRFCGNARNFWNEDFFWFSPFLFYPRSRIQINKVFVPPQN